MKTFDIYNIKRGYEEFEKAYLSKYACLSSASLGRKEPDEECSLRTVFQRDRDKILHSKAFRRLKHKTQVFITPIDDHYRTRLTHTLEVSQISRTIARALRLNEDLTEAIALGHDLGHTPFGHTGEEVLNELLPDGFSHNKQSIRTVTLIENLNLTRETLDGILNHTGDTKPFTLEGQVVKISDRIAYLNHDVDDAIRANIIKIDDLPEECLKYFGYRKSDSIQKMVFDIIENSYEKDTVLMSEECFNKLSILRTWMFENVYMVKKEEAKVKKIVKDLFGAYYDMLQKQYINLDDTTLKTIVADYIAGMTDRYALNKYKQFFLGKENSSIQNDSFLYKLVEQTQNRKTN